MMKRIILHWTAGAYTPNATDLEHYHYLITGKGQIVKGKYSVEDNENCNDGVYAAHCGGGNTDTIGVAVCAMAGFSSRQKVGKYPITKVQCERLFKLIAELVKKYTILIAANTVMTHYEFGKAHPYTSSYGKIDIIYLPPYPQIAQWNIGEFIRNKAKWYYKNLK